MASSQTVSSWTEDEARNLPSKTLIQGIFSKSHSIKISEYSRFLNRDQYRQIGQGQCGTIYAIQDRRVRKDLGSRSTAVLKLANYPRKVSEIRNDHEKHISVAETFLQTSSISKEGSDIDIPDVLSDPLETESTWFWGLAGAGAHPLGSPKDGFFTSRIYPIPEVVRAALVDVYAPRSLQEKEAKQKFLDKEQQADCLVRIYLGRRLAKGEERPLSNENFTLRNFPLHVNEMEDLGLDTHQYAKIMARSLALLHWAARNDANDVEFVLGTTASSISSYIQKDSDDFEVGMWLLDFNQCQTLENDLDRRIKQLVDGFFWNDPYYPRPNLKGNKEDVILWTTFKETYLEVGKTILQNTREEDHPAQFLAAVEEKGESRSQSAFSTAGQNGSPSVFASLFDWKSLAWSLFGLILLAWSLPR
ncbi:hypothetical protein EG327_005371 [Venturia inaequalis]|uniref:DUF3669 domain-containing protein n=1 Tax=Venturia inaequalis TaxID=5025 RepID=A0A8H3ZBY6_VENIN|nr:hypothetical protein EG327_005371 [Venturia inaequalis]